MSKVKTRRVDSKESGSKHQCPLRFNAQKATAGQRDSIKEINRHGKGKVASVEFATTTAPTQVLCAAFV